MYIKKSIMSAAVIIFGVFLLTVMAILFCFTEIRIPSYASIAMWIACIKIIVDIVGKIEMPQERSAERRVTNCRNVKIVSEDW